MTSPTKLPQGQGRGAALKRLWDAQRNGRKKAGPKHKPIKARDTSPEAEAEAKAKFIAKYGVSRCPTAVCTPTLQLAKPLTEPVPDYFILITGGKR